jgi:hypothetical protein
MAGHGKSHGADTDEANPCSHEILPGTAQTASAAAMGSTFALPQRPTVIELKNEPGQSRSCSSSTDACSPQTVSSGVCTSLRKWNSLSAFPVANLLPSPGMNEV